MLLDGWWFGVREKCGVIGVYGSPDAARLTYYGLWALQHRGQESSGIVSSDEGRLHSRIAPGLVAHVYDESDLASLTGNLAIGHNRYSTSGGNHDRHSQPVIIADVNLAFAHNGNLPVTEDLENFLTDHGISTTDKNDSALMAEAIAFYIRGGASLHDAIVQSYPLFTGAFSCVATDGVALATFRDSCGIRPLALGRLEDGYVVASETCALDTIGAQYVREVAPGELVMIDKDGLHSTKVVRGHQKLDIFEFIYFARPDSEILGRRVNEVRRNLGRQLALESPVQADVVIGTPDSGIPAALGYASITGIPYDQGLIKNRYIHRTFIRPAQSLRQRDVQMKLNPVPEVVAGKSVAVIDDSLVRGTTSRQLVAMLRRAGATSVHLLISSPPVLYPDFYGIDTPNQEDLIAANMSPTELTTHIGADSVRFLSYDGMIRATGLPASTFSTACFNGVYPIDIKHLSETFVPVAA